MSSLQEIFEAVLMEGEYKMTRVAGMPKYLATSDSGDTATYHVDNLKIAKARADKKFGKGKYKLSAEFSNGVNKKWVEQDSDGYFTEK